MAILAGIDPGFTGAIAFLDTKTGELIVHDMPVLPGPKGRTEIDLTALAHLLAPPEGVRCVSLLEVVAPRPKEGIVSSFRFGQGYGVLQMALAGHGWEQHRVTPTTWKKHFGLSSDKGVSRGMAKQRFPRTAQAFDRVKDHGRAEAALIALYGKEKILGA